MSFLSSTETTVISTFAGVANTYGTYLLGTFRPVFIVGFSIWITLIGYEVAYGKTEDGLGYILTKIFRMFLVGTIALYGWPMVTEIILGLKEGFVGSPTVSTSLETNLIAPLIAHYRALWVWFLGSFSGMGMTDVVDALINVVQFAVLGLVFTLMFAVIIFICCVSLAMYLVSNSVLLMLLAFGPFFLLCLAFPFTQKYFETYIGSVMTAILGMAFTTLMIQFVAGFFGLTGSASTIPTTSTIASIAVDVPSFAKFYAAKLGVALLIVYMYYKIFDLAAALGGGINMGNNMIGAMRTIARDTLGGGNKAGGSAGASGKNSVSEGKGGSNSDSGGGRSSVRDAMAANRSLTGMAISGAAGGAMAAGRGAATAGTYAYNRGSAAVRSMTTAFKPKQELSLAPKS